MPRWEDHDISLIHNKVIEPIVNDKTANQVILVAVEKKCSCHY